MRTIAIVNQKGGCGKTTTAISLAGVFARRGLRTLLVDLDPQSHCAAGLGVPEERIELSMFDALRAEGAGVDADRLVWSVCRNLWLAPSTMRLAALEAPAGGLHGLPDRDRRLERMLSRLAGRFDRCVIDCPPTIGLLTFNALRAARDVVIPVETGYFSLKGAERQWETVRHVVDHIGRPIRCMIVPTLHRPGEALADDVLRVLRGRFGDAVAPVAIRCDEALRRAASMGQSVVEYAPDSAAREDHEALADWLEEGRDGALIEVRVRGDVPAAGPRDPDGPGGFDGDAMAGGADGGPVRGDRPDAAMHGACPPRASAAPAVPAHAAPGAGEPDPGPHGAVAVRTPQRGTVPTSSRAAELAGRLREMADPTGRNAPAPIDTVLPAHAGGGSAPAAPVTSVTPVMPDMPASRAAVSRPAVDRTDVPATGATGNPVADPAEETTRDLGDAGPLGLRQGVRPGVRIVEGGVLFVQPAPASGSIAVAGVFNGWSSHATELAPDARTPGVVSARVVLPAGTFEYRLVHQGRWYPDPHNPQQTLNEFGEANSIIRVPDHTAEPS